MGGPLRARWLVVFACIQLGCGKPDLTAPDGPGTASPQDFAAPSVETPNVSIVGQGDGPLRFDDVAEKVGIRFRHDAPLTPERHVHLFLGSGIGWLDWDRDGWSDLYCCQGAPYPLAGGDSDRAGSDELLRNLGGERFVEVADLAGLHHTGHSMGIAVADFDHDGFPDFCVTGYGENGLFHNRGDGCFVRKAIPNEVLPGRLSASCAWGDIDADGNPDLFITNYAQLGPDDYPTCRHTLGGVTIPISCHPSNLTHVFDQLLWNRGDGTFEDITGSSGIRDGAAQPGLGVIAADLDSDGDIDFYVANDTTPNQLWENLGDRRFIDRGDSSGTSRNRYGATEAGMGVIAGDITGNGRIDLFVTNYYGETNTLYRNEGGLLFADVTDEVGLGAPSRWRLGFGTSLVDFDNDSYLDVLVVNGHVQDRLHEIHRDEPFAQLPLLFRNERGRFRDVSAGSGEFFRQPHVGRSTAAADYDRDGDVDIAVNCLNDFASLLQNVARSSHRWMQIELVGRSSNRAGIGAVLYVSLGDRQLARCVHGGTGYLSSDDTSILFGLGDFAGEPDVTVLWPGGRRETWQAVPTNRLCQLIEGTGSKSGAAQ